MIKNKAKKGVALVYALMVTAVILTLISAMTKFMLDSLESTKKQLSSNFQINSIARAGIEDSYMWFSRAQQNVKTSDIDSKLKEAIKKPTYVDKGDTDNKCIGLTRDILLDAQNRIYGHYEIRRPLDSSILSSLGVTDNDNTIDMEDISSSRIYSTDPLDIEGRVWKVFSKAYIYRRPSDDETSKDDRGIFNDRCCIDYNKSNVNTAKDKIEKYYYETCNNSPYSSNGTSISETQIIAKGYATAEIRRLDLNIPPAAISIVNSGGVNTSDNEARITGGPAPAVLTPSAVALTGAGTRVTGTPSPNFVDTTLASRITLDSVFGMGSNELRGVATEVFTSMNDYTSSQRIRASSILYFENGAAFTVAKPLKGSGILYVNGNLSFEEGSDSFFSGVVYVNNGNVTINGENSITGTLIVPTAGKTVLLTAGVGNAIVEYNATIISEVLKKLGGYRLNSLSFRFVD